MSKKFKDYTLENVSENASYPYYGVFNAKGELVDKLRCPSDFKHAVWRDMYLTDSDGRQRVFTDVMVSLGTAYRYGTNCVEKVWNRGRGRLAMFKLYHDKQIILCNKTLVNSRDREHLAEAMRILGIEGFAIKEVSYGYPDYYSKSFNLSLLNE